MDNIPSFAKPLDNTGNTQSMANHTEDIDVIFDEERPKENFSVKNLVGADSEVWNPDYDGASFSPIREPSTGRLLQMDYSFHNSNTFPHMHHPLQPHFHRHKNRRKEHGRHRKKSDNVKFEVGDTELQDGWTTKAPISSENDEASPIEKVKSFSDTDNEEKELMDNRTRRFTDNSIFSTDDEALEAAPLLSPKLTQLRSIIRSETDTAGSEDEATKKAKSKVQFSIEKWKPHGTHKHIKGSDAGESDHEKPSRIHHKKRKHRRKPAFSEDPSKRLARGSETRLQIYEAAKPTTDDEAEQLRDQDLTIMSNHRFADSSYHRRHRAKSLISTFLHPSVVAAKAAGKSLPSMKKTFDHTPHEIFVELSELQYTDNTPEWKETARWIKYEEDVEGADNRWGKPHIAFLDFNALFSLRKGLDKGAVLFDLDEQDLPSIAARVVDHMVSCDLVPAEERDAVIRVLLLGHKHIKEQPNLLRRASRASGLHLIGSSMEKLPNSQSSGMLSENRGSARRLSNIFLGGPKRRRSSTDDVNGVQINMEDSESREKSKKDLMKKLPEGIEASAILVGAVDFLKSPTIALVRLAEGVVMENLVEISIPVRFLFILLGPFQCEMDYHEVGRSIATLMSDKAFHDVAYQAHSKSQLLAAINDFLNASIVLPPSDWNDKDLIPFDKMREKSQEILRKTEAMKALKDKESGVTVVAPSKAITITNDDGKGDPPRRNPLKRKGKLFYGVIQDIKIRFPQYPSDILDGLNTQVLSAMFFIFFASLSPSITFGGMYAEQTGRYIGVGETLLVTSINGILFALLGAQPLLIVGSTGPLMVFDMSLFRFCKSMELDYLALRVWVGLWMIIIGVLISAFEGMCIVKKFTRFTEEIFSSLICLIFTVGAFTSLAKIFAKHPLGNSYYAQFSDNNATEITDGVLINGTLYNGTTADGNETEIDVVIKNQPNTALLSMCLMFGTFLIAIKLKYFRNSKYLGRGIRRALGDFGVPIAIVLMVLVDFFINDTFTDKLSMPPGLQPSNSEIRGWLINPFGVVDPLPIWAMIAAGPAALLLFILIFLEISICHLILNKPERCLKKGTGFHWDMMVCCIASLISGVLGGPFMTPACVRTIAHMSSLTIMDTNVPPGESPRIVGCHEQRLSGFLVALFIGLAVFLSAILNLVPNSVLLGIFLYMGISASGGIQMLDRTILFLIPVKHHPNVPYVRNVRTWKMNCFTGVQIVALIVLWIVMQSPASLCMPFILICLIPIRLFLLPKFFDQTELQALDGTEQKTLMESPHDEPDFYEVMHDLPHLKEDDVKQS